MELVTGFIILGVGAFIGFFGKASEYFFKWYDNRKVKKQKGSYKSEYLSCAACGRMTEHADGGEELGWLCLECAYERPEPIRVEYYYNQAALQMGIDPIPIEEKKPKSEEPKQYTRELMLLGD